MYTIFINESKLILTSILVEDLKEGEVFYPIKEVNLTKLLHKLHKGKLRIAYLYHPKEKKLFKKIKKRISVITAAGGVVRNLKEELLFIYRNKKWDFPKGGVEKDETIEEAAIREVKEETGVRGLYMVCFLENTYHIFEKKGKYILKKVYWYSMKSDSSQDLIPQEEEGITKVEWKAEEQFSEIVRNSYSSVKVLLSSL